MTTSDIVAFTLVCIGGTLAWLALWMLVSDRDHEALVAAVGGALFITGLAIGVVTQS